MKTSRYMDLSLMRAIACIGIVVLHTVFAANEYFAGVISPAENMVSRIVENNMMWAVPGFIMVTGVLQLDPKRSLTLRKLYGRYILRIFIALVACCILFRLFDMVMDGEGFSLTGLLQAFAELVTARCWGHLWYLYLLIGLYVLLPFYRKLTGHCTDRELLYLCGAYLLFVSVFPMIEGFGVPIGFYISESIIYPLYLFLGHMIRTQRLAISRRTGIALIAGSTAVIVMLDLMKYGMGLDVPGELFGYASPAVIAQAIGVFSVICSGEAEQQMQKKSRGGRFLQTFDGCSFGIYLIHMIFIRILFRYLQMNPYMGPPGLVMAAVILEILLVSFMIVWLLKKIPGVKWVL